MSTATPEEPEASPPPTAAVLSPTSASAPATISASAAASLSQPLPRQVVTKIGVLPSSLPAYHKDYMEREKAGIHDVPPPATSVNEEPAKARTEAEKEELSRRLKPHSKRGRPIPESPMAMHHPWAYIHLRVRINFLAAKFVGSVCVPNDMGAGG